MVWVLIINAASYGQKAEAPDQSYSLGAKINEMTLTIGGILVVATNDGLTAFKPTESEPIFTFNDFGKLKPQETQFIPNSPYIVISQGANSKLAGLTKTKRAVIDYVSGKVLFKSDEANWNQIYTCNIMLPQNKLVVSGIQKSGKRAENLTARVAVYDLETGLEDYQFFLIEPGKVSMKYFAVTGTPLLLEDKLLVPTSQGIIAKDKSGKTLWENKAKNVNWMTSNKKESDVYCFAATANLKNTRIYKLDANGNEVWPDERKVKGSVVNFEILPQGIAVVSNKGDGSDGSAFSTKSESVIAFMDATTGEDLWDKAPKTKGYVQHFYVMDDGILFGIQSGGINKISFDGKELFRKPLKTGENIMVMAETPQGLLYITGEDTNIIDLKTGEPVWKKPLKYKNSDNVASTFDQANGRYLIAANETIFAVDANNSDITEIAEVDFEEKESPSDMEIRDGKVFLVSSQNVMMLGADGEVIFHEYYKSPSKSGFMKMVSAVGAVASTALMVASAANAGMNRSGSDINSLKSYNDYGAESKRAADMFGDISSASFAALSKRFKATSATENSQFILTKLDGGVGLIKVDKDSGKIDKEILLKDKKPEYKVDDYGGFLYYKANDKTIYAYNMN